LFPPFRVHSTIPAQWQAFAGVRVARALGCVLGLAFFTDVALQAVIAALLMTVSAAVATLSVAIVAFLAFIVLHFAVTTIRQLLAAIARAYPSDRRIAVFARVVTPVAATLVATAPIAAIAWTSVAIVAFLAQRIEQPIAARSQERLLELGVASFVATVARGNISVVTLLAHSPLAIATHGRVVCSATIPG
jgi:hypothetical protein